MNKTELTQFWFHLQRTIMKQQFWWSWVRPLCLWGSERTRPGPWPSRTSLSVRRILTQYSGLPGSGRWVLQQQNRTEQNILNFFYILIYSSYSYLTLTIKGFDTNLTCGTASLMRFESQMYFYLDRSSVNWELYISVYSSSLLVKRVFHGPGHTCLNETTSKIGMAAGPLQTKVTITNSILSLFITICKPILWDIRKFLLKFYSSALLDPWCSSREFWLHYEEPPLHPREGSHNSHGPTD